MVLYLTAHNSFTVIELGFEKPFKNSSLLTFLKGEVTVRKSLFLICCSCWSFAQEQIRSKEPCVLVEMSSPCWRGAASLSPAALPSHHVSSGDLSEITGDTIYLPFIDQTSQELNSHPKDLQSLFWLRRITAGPTQERLQSFEQH